MERGVGTSQFRPEGDVMMSMMAQMMARMEVRMDDMQFKVKNEIMSVKNELKESEARNQDTYNTLLGGIKALKRRRREKVSKHHEHLSNTMRNVKHHEHLSKEREREREKRLNSKSEHEKPRECGGGERKEKYQIREKPQAQVSQECLLDSKDNLGWAPNKPLPFALGEENKISPTNTSYMFSYVDDFVMSNNESIKVNHLVVHGLETNTSEKDQEGQGQVEELLAQGSSALFLFPFEISLKYIDKLDVLQNKMLYKFDEKHVEPILYVGNDFVGSRITSVNVLELKGPSALIVLALVISVKCGLLSISL